MRPSLLCTVLLLCCCQAARAGEKTFPRYLEFRDGSVLRLQVVDEPCPVTLIRGAGRIEQVTVPLSSLDEVMLTAEEGFARKRTLLAAVQQLGSDLFRQREQAQATLLKMGAEARPDLLACLQLTADTEGQSRLRAILEKLPPQAGAATSLSVTFDRFRFQEPCWGHLGDRGIPVVVNGATYRLTRKDVLGMTSEQPQVFGLTTGQAVPGGFTRINEHEFPPGCVEEGFERTPEGRPLQIGENIEKLFLARGFLLSTSVAGSHVSVNNFTVQGKSKGLSVATHNPLWTGEVSITFVQPGHADVPAGVTHFGCYIAAVMPRGTALTAYDLRGRELGTVHTERQGVEFLGVRSAVPIYRVRIVPNLQIDPDYTLDDFIFAPARSNDFTHPSKYVVQLADGDRVLCGDVTFGGGAVRLQGMPAGLPDRSCKLQEVRQINAPRPQQATRQAAAGVFAELRDGSIIFGRESAERDNTVFARWPDALKEKDNLVGLWGSTFPRLAHVPKSGWPVVWSEDSHQWQQVSGVRLLELIVHWKGADGKSAERGYRKLAPLWFAAPSPGPAPGSWHVRTVLGEDLLLADPAALAGSLSRELSAVWQGRPVRLPAGEVRSIYQAPKGG